MAKGARASTKKANNQKLKSRVFGPVESARTERLSAKLLELASQPKPKPVKEDIVMESEEGRDNQVSMYVKPLTQLQQRTMRFQLRANKQGVCPFHRYLRNTWLTFYMQRWNWTRRLQRPAIVQGPQAKAGLRRGDTTARHP